MFKNLKQKLENLSANSPGKSASMPTDEGKTEERLQSSAADQDEEIEKALKSSEQKAEASIDAEIKSQGAVGQPDKDSQGADDPDPMLLTKEELETTNRVLLGQVKNLEDSKNETCRKLSRRLGELEEQIQLDRQAKRDLEHSYALMLDEKDELITVLKTQVQLLKSSQPVVAGSEEQEEGKTDIHDCPISLEEVTVLKEKVKKLETLLTKCKDTIKSNKERTKQLTQEKEELMKANEETIKELQSKHEKELKAKMADLQEEILALSEVRSGLNDQLVQLTGRLSEREKAIETKEKDFNEKMIKVQKDMEKLNAKFKKTQKSAAPKTPSEAEAKDDSAASEVAEETVEESSPASATNVLEELEKLKELYDLRGKELVQVLEDRNTVRKELNSQRERFAKVLERYDEQMKVVQGELTERMKPGPIEASLMKEVWTILSGDEVSAVDSSTEKEKSIESKKPEEKSARAEKKAEVTSSESPAEASSSEADKPDLVPRGELETAKARLGKVLALLERCAKQIDGREALDNRWKERLAEAESKSAAQLRASQATIDRLNDQIMELTNRENLLNANLERARQDSDAILQQQRADMNALQTTVEQLLERENQLKSQIQRTKMMCDAEVARVTAENLESVQRLSNTFQETQTTLSDLSKELLESKDHSERMIMALQQDLDEKCRMLQCTADFIESTGDNTFKSAFLKIVLECSGGHVSEEPTAGESKTDEVSVDLSDAPHAGGEGVALRNVANNDEVVAQVSTCKTSEKEIVSVENCKSSVTADRKEVRIESRNQQELIEFCLPRMENPSSTSGTTQRNSNSRETLRRASPFDLELVAKICSRRTFMHGSPGHAWASDNTKTNDLSELRSLGREVKSLKVKLSRSERRCRELEMENSSLVETNFVHQRNLARTEEQCSELWSKHESEKSKSNKTSDDYEASQFQQLNRLADEPGGSILPSDDAKISELLSRLDELSRKLQTSEEMIKELKEMNAKLEKDAKLKCELRLKKEKPERIQDLGAEDGTPNRSSVKEEVGDLEETSGSLSPEEKLSSVVTERHGSGEGSEIVPIDPELKKQSPILDKSDIELRKSFNSQADHKLENIESVQSEIDRLKPKVEEHEKEKTYLMEVIESLKLEIQALTQEGFRMKQKLDEYEAKQEELDSLREKLAQKEIEYKCLEHEVTEVRERLEKALEVHKTRIETLEEEASKNESIKLELRASLEELDRLQKETSFRRLESEDLMEKMSGLEKEKEESLRTIKEIQQDKERLHLELENSKKNLDELTNNSAKFENEIFSLREVLKNQEASNIELNTTLSALLKDKESFTTERQTFERTIENLKLENIELNKNVQNINEMLERLKSENSLQLEDLNSKQAELEEMVKSKKRDYASHQEMEDRLMQQKDRSTDFETNQEFMSERVTPVKQLEEKIQFLIYNNKKTLEENQRRSVEKDLILSQCFYKLSSAQLLLSEAASKVSILESRVQELTNLNSELKERALSEDKDTLISSLKEEIKVLKESCNSAPQNNATTLSSEPEFLKDSQELSPLVNKVSRVKTKSDESQESSEEWTNKDEELQQQLDALTFTLEMKEKELEEMRNNYGDLVQKYEEAEMSLSKKHVYYNDGSNVMTVTRSKQDASETSDYLPELGIQSSDTRRLEKLEEDVNKFDILMAGEETLAMNDPAEENITKIRINLQQKELCTGGILTETCSTSQDKEALLAELEQVKRLLEESRQEVESLKHREELLVSRRHGFASKGLASPPPREHLDSLDLSQDIFLTPDKSSKGGIEKCQIEGSVSCVDDHHQNLVDLSPIKYSTMHERAVSQQIESSNEKSDSDLLDLADAQVHPHGSPYPPKELDCDELHKRYYLLTKEVERLNSELHFYYANSHLKHHHQEEIIEKHDSFLDLTEPTELEYLRNVLYKYMLGTETKTLAKVICTVVRFSEDQTKRILEKEDSRPYAFGARK